MNRTFEMDCGNRVVVGAFAAAAMYANWDNSVQIVAMGVNYVRYMNAPAGTISIEVAAGSKSPMTVRKDTSAQAGGPRGFECPVVVFQSLAGLA